MNFKYIKIEKWALWGIYKSVKSESPRVSLRLDVATRLHISPLGSQHQPHPFKAEASPIRSTSAFELFPRNILGYIIWNMFRIVTYIKVKDSAAAASFCDLGTYQTIWSKEHSLNFTQNYTTLWSEAD